MTGNFCMCSLDSYVMRWTFIHDNVHTLISWWYKEAHYLTRLRWIGDHLILDVVSIFFKSGVNWVMSSNLKTTQCQKMSHLAENGEFLWCYMPISDNCVYIEPLVYETLDGPSKHKFLHGLGTGSLRHLDYFIVQNCVGHRVQKSIGAVLGAETTVTTPVTCQCQACVFSLVHYLSPFPLPPLCHHRYQFGGLGGIVRGLWHMCHIDKIEEVTISDVCGFITYLVLYTVNTATDISRMTQRHTSTVAKHRINDITHVWYRWYDVLPLRPCAHARSSSNNSAYFGGEKWSCWFPIHVVVLLLSNSNIIVIWN